METEGLIHRCTPLVPCIAFRAGNDVHLVNHDSLVYRIAEGASYLSFTAWRRRTERERRILWSVNEGREERLWVTVGFGFLEAELVAGELPESTAAGSRRLCRGRDLQDPSRLPDRRPCRRPDGAVYRRFCRCFSRKRPDARGVLVERILDAADRPTFIDHPDDALDVTYAYDAAPAALPQSRRRVNSPHRRVRPRPSASESFGARPGTVGGGRAGEPARPGHSAARAPGRGGACSS